MSEKEFPTINHGIYLCYVSGSYVSFHFEIRGTVPSSNEGKHAFAISLFHAWNKYSTNI